MKQCAKCHGDTTITKSGLCMGCYFKYSRDED